jgi:glucoamylase
LGVAEQIYDALITWDLLGELEVTQLSLAFFQQFDQHVKVGRYRKCSGVYAHLTDALRNWAEKTLLFVADHIPDDYVLPMAMDRITAQPTGSRGTIHCLIASLSLYNAYKGLVPPSWYNGGHSTNGCSTPIRGESRDGAGSWVLKNIGSGIESQYCAGL